MNKDELLKDSFMKIVYTLNNWEMDSDYQDDYYKGEIINLLNEFEINHKNFYKQELENLINKLEKARNEKFK